MKCWSEEPFISYLNAVDDLMEERYGAVSTPEDTDEIASCHEEGYTPDETARWLHDRKDGSR